MKQKKSKAKPEENRRIVVGEDPFRKIKNPQPFDINITKALALNHQERIDNLMRSLRRPEVMTSGENSTIMTVSESPQFAKLDVTRSSPSEDAKKAARDFRKNLLDLCKVDIKENDSTFDIENVKRVFEYYGTERTALFGIARLLSEVILSGDEHLKKLVVPFLDAKTFLSAACVLNDAILLAREYLKETD